MLTPFIRTKADVIKRKLGLSCIIKGYLSWNGWKKQIYSCIIYSGCTIKDKDKDKDLQDILMKWASISEIPDNKIILVRDFNALLYRPAASSLTVCSKEDMPMFRWREQTSIVGLIIRTEKLAKIVTKWWVLAIEEDLSYHYNIKFEINNSTMHITDKPHIRLKPRSVEKRFHKECL